MTIRKLDHVNIRTADLAATRRFYTEVMGMTDGYRPPFDFPGIWIYAGDAPVIHVTDISKGSPRHPADGRIPEGTGMVDHIAFFGDDAEALLLLALFSSERPFIDRTGKTHGIRLRMIPPMKAKTIACKNGPHPVESPSPTP